jgi:hypothetical protein
MRALAASLLICGLLWTLPASADAMRCNGRLIGDGDTRAEVRALCGNPADVQTRTILRRPFVNFHGRLVHFGDGLIEVPIETWTYNFGPYKLIRRVRFVDGIVEEIETLGYGYRAPPGSEGGG